jgi:hypothetical protein
MTAHQDKKTQAWVKGGRQLKRMCSLQASLPLGGKVLSEVVCFALEVGLIYLLLEVLIGAICKNLPVMSSVVNLVESWKGSCISGNLSRTQESRVKIQSNGRGPRPPGPSFGLDSYTRHHLSGNLHMKFSPRWKSVMDLVVTLGNEACHTRQSTFSGKHYLRKF